jgi:hypothetical protein
MEDQVRRSIMIALIALLALAVAVPTALAQGKGGKPQDINVYLQQIDQENPIDLPAGTVCSDFAVRLEENGTFKTLELPGDRLIMANPNLTATLTNLTTRKEVTVVITGATNQTTDADGNVVTKVTGLNLLFDPVAGFVIAKGNFSFVFDKDGNLIQPLQGTGQLTDICGLLS